MPEAPAGREDSAWAAAVRVVRRVLRGDGIPAYVPDLIRRSARVVLLTFQRSRPGRLVTPSYWLARRGTTEALTGRVSPEAQPRFSHGTWVTAAEDDATRRSIESVRELPEIDAVFTWVDGSDPAWLDDYREAVGRVDVGEKGPLAVNRSRYRDRGELRAALTAVAAYAPWVRRIHLVTAGQAPAWLDRDLVRVVDHREILDPGDLPTFNSHAIEAALHRIDGLAEHWIYLNDDVLLGRPFRPEEFFPSEGMLALFPDPSASIPPTSAAPVDRAARLTRTLVGELTGRTVEHKLRHAPHPQLRSVAEELEDLIPDRLAATRASPFRSPDDVSLPSSLTPRYAEATGRGLATDLDVEYINIASRWARLQMREFELRRHHAVVCLNETSVPPDDERRVDAMVARFLERAYPPGSRSNASDDR